MGTFHIPTILNLNREGLYEGHNHSTYQMNPKFLVNAILCAPTPLFHEILNKKNAVILLMRDSYSNAAI